MAEKDAVRKLLQSPAMHVDEASLRIDQKNHWIHVYAAGDFAPPDAQDKAASESALLVMLLRFNGCNPKLDK